MIDKRKIVFITVDWMKYYKGITENDKPLGTGGSYPSDKKHEIFNFFDDEGTCYGYTPPYGRINLKRIQKNDIRQGPDENKYIENVLVVFNASKNDGQGRRIIGFYVGATVFKEPFQNTNPKRKIVSSNSFASYNIRVKSEDAYLLDHENERDIYLPFSKKDGYGYGQSNIWYADDSLSMQFRDDIVNKLQDIINETVVDILYDDERKYYEGEIHSKVKKVITIKRNADARRKCLNHYFSNNNYRCLLCGFDFVKQYGVLGEKFIEVHHIESHTIKSKSTGIHEIDPVKELIPVCSNCHSIIHRRRPELSIETIKEALSI